MSSRDIHDLHPIVREKARVFLIMAAQIGINLLITMTYRSSEEQDMLYAQGRAGPGKIVTNVKGGESAHNYKYNNKPAALAFDCIPVDTEGKPIWDTPVEVWETLYQVADKVGLDPMGAKGGEYWSKDKGHFTEPGWRIIHNGGIV